MFDHLWKTKIIKPRLNALIKDEATELFIVVWEDTLVHLMCQLHCLCWLVIDQAAVLYWKSHLF